MLINATRRRALMAVIAAMPAGKVAAAKTVRQVASTGDRRVLIASFSRTGNTRVVAGLLQRAFEADSFEIQPVTPYPAEYLATVEQAKLERDAGITPPLAARVPDMARYDTIFLGFPIWGETAPPVIRSFLKAHDLKGKTLVPFVLM